MQRSQDAVRNWPLLPSQRFLPGLLAVCIFGLAFCAIGLWEFLKWGFAFLLRRAFGTSSVSLSPRKARKLQRLRDRTETASCDRFREECASFHHQLVSLQRQRATSFIAPRPVPHLPIRASLSCLRSASSATGARQIAYSIAHVRASTALTGRCTPLSRPASSAFLLQRGAVRALAL